MTRKHLGKSEIENKRRIATGVDPKVLGDLANAQGRLAKLLAKTTKNDKEVDDSSGKK